MLARLALPRGDAETARGLLDPLTSPPPDEGTGASARYYLGLAETRLGKFAHARELLLPFLPPGRRRRAGRRFAGRAARRAGRGDRRRRRRARRRSSCGTPTRAAGASRRRLTRANASRRSPRQLSPDAAVQTYRAAPREGAGARAARRKAAASALRSARRQLGGRGDRVGDGVGTRGARGSSGRASAPARPAIRASRVSSWRCRASFSRWARRRCGRPCWRRALPARRVCSCSCAMRAATPSAPAAASSELARGESVIGIVGGARSPGAGFEADGRLRQAARSRHCPLLVLDDAAPGRRPRRVLAGPRAPARASRAGRRRRLRAGRARLRHASARTARRESALRRCLPERRRRRGAAGVTAEASYPPGATSFTTAVAAIKKSRAAGRVRRRRRRPAGADRAGAGRRRSVGGAVGGAPAAPATPGKPRPRNVLLLSTAADLSPRLLQSAGRYVQGALLAPGFYAGADRSARAAAFVDAYRAAYGQDPHATEAYAYDGVNAIRAAVAAGARTRGPSLTNALVDRHVRGADGRAHFGRRSRPGRSAAPLRGRRGRDQDLPLTFLRRGGEAACAASRRRRPVIQPARAS